MAAPRSLMSRVFEELHTVATLPQLLAWRIQQSPQSEAYREFDPVKAAWVGISWADFGARVEALKAALAGLDLPRGARVALLLPNGIDAVGIDQAALAVAAVPVPTHALDNPASIAYILADSDAAVLFAQSQAQWQAIAGVGQALPALRQVVLVEPPSTHARAGWRAGAQPGGVAGGGQASRTAIARAGCR